VAAVIRMSNEEYEILKFKRLLATLFFKYTAPEFITNERAIERADALLKDLD
jgi:hypothetical protein